MKSDEDLPLLIALIATVLDVPCDKKDLINLYRNRKVIPSKHSFAPISVAKFNQQSARNKFI